MRQCCIHYLRRALFPTKVLDYYFKRLISVFKPKNVSLSIATQITQRQNKTYYSVTHIYTYLITHISLLRWHWDIIWHLWLWKTKRKTQAPRQVTHNIVSTPEKFPALDKLSEMEHKSNDVWNSPNLHFKWRFRCIPTASWFLEWRLRQTAKVRFKLRLSKNRTWAAKNSAKQLV